MNENELALILRDRYDHAKRNETILEIDLFGIKYSRIIRDSGLSIKRIVQYSGLSESYITELTKGVKLGAYVQRTENNT